MAENMRCKDIYAQQTTSRFSVYTCILVCTFFHVIEFIILLANSY